MNCPVCKDEVMIILELDEIEVDYCGFCKGVWLDEGELEEIINLGTAADNNRILHLLRNIFNYRD